MIYPPFSDNRQNNIIDMNNSTSSQDIPVSPLNPKSAEWVQLHNTVEMLRIELSDKLQETARIMHAWESRLIDEQEECRDMNRHLTMMDKRREERRASFEAEEKARYESSLESISKEKDAEIFRLQEEINAKNKSINRLNSKISELQILISKIEHLSQIVETRFDIHTADADVILESISSKFCDYEKQIQTLKEDLLFSQRIRLTSWRVWKAANRNNGTPPTEREIISRPGNHELNH